MRNDELANLLTDDVADWIGEQLARKTAARRKGEDLLKLIQGKQLRKKQIMNVFDRWLDERRNLTDEDLIDVE